MHYVTSSRDHLDFCLKRKSRELGRVIGVYPETKHPRIRTIHSYADAIGPDKRTILPQDASGRLGSVIPLIEAAHAAGLLVHT